MKLTTEQKKTVATALAVLAVIPFIATIVWVILALIFGLSVSWLQVLGGIILIDLLKSLVLSKI